MANPVQRLRYFDGEYLRSYDFTDEQSYHIAMRRLMNRRLHLHGIIYGLEIVKDQDSIPGGDSFYSIASGMAIDDLGREIAVLAPYSLTHDLTGPNLAAGSSYDVWICYDETQTALPAAGYQDCNAAKQYTRWQEGFAVQLIPLVGPSVVTKCDGIRLGTVTLGVSLSGLGLAITWLDLSKRHFVGIRAQRIVPADEEKDSFDITKQNIDPTKRIPLAGYLDIEPSALERGNFIVEKNVVIGDDFVLDNQTYKNLPKDFTKIPTGNLKITSDLFVNGDSYFYSTDDATWYSLKQYIQSVMPRITSGTIEVDLPALSDTGGAPGTSGSATAQFKSFPAGGTTQILLSISEMDWQDPNNLTNYWGGLGTITISLGSPAINPGPPGFSTLNVPWTVDPVADVVSDSKWEFPVTKLVISYIVIYQP